MDWISVNDRQPEPETDVLCSGVNPIYGDRLVFSAGRFNGEWMSAETQDRCRYEVTHWMPLPAEPERPTGAPGRVAMNAERKILHDLKNKLADDRAHRIASMAAEELLRTEGEPTSGIDEFAIPLCSADDHLRECIAHLCWHGEAASHETDDEYIVVQFGDFTLDC